ncbi:tRNA G46 methylase TrmB [Bradyrhizobium barranii subsp. barranii]
MSERKSDPDRDDSERAFFGRRKGHKLRQHQAELIDHLLPHLSLDIEGEKPANANEIFDPAADDVRLEIGFGGGEHLAAEAQNFSTTGFIGCEPYVNGMAKILAQIEAANISNIRLFAGDAAELLAWLPQASLSRIDLIHPDPWPKRRHWKRRFVQDRDHRCDGARAESGRRIPLRLRYRRLLRVDADASGAVDGFSVARRMRR